MTETKKTPMTVKRFIRQATSSKVSAMAFLQANRDFLLTGELVNLTMPILVKLDSKEILPTPALQEITSAVFNHMLEVSAKVETEKQARKSETTSKSNYRVTIYNSSGNVMTRTNSKNEEEELVKGFNSDLDAEGWADRRLFDGASDWYAVIVYANGSERIVMRSDSIARILRKSKGPVMKAHSKTTNRLGFGVAVHNDRSTFSKG